MAFERPTSRAGLSRRDFLAAGGASAAGLLLAGLSGCGGDGAAGAEGVPQPLRGAAAAPAGVPNLLFIVADDHRWDHLGAMGHPFLQTPHLDRLAVEGQLFANAFVTTSLCSPSRASTLTGRYARSHGVQNNLTPWNNAQETFLEPLARAGYRNAFIGKWHMPGRLPNLRGVERFVTFTVQAGQGRYFDCPLIIDGVETARPDTYITTDLTDFAIDFLRQGDGRPFCLYLSHKAAHHQFLPPPDLEGLYDGADLSLLPEEYFAWQTALETNLWEGALGPLARHYRNYCAAITGIDRELGRLLAELEALGQLDNTVIVYTADNGYSWGEHVLNGKRWAREENMRVPFLVRHPGATLAPGSRPEEMVLNVDIAPSLLDLAGVPVPAGVHGRSIEPLLDGQQLSWRDAFLYEYFQDFPYNVPAHKAVRTDQYLYVEYAGRRDPVLYDVAADPRTLHNIADTPEGQALLPALQARLAAEEAALA